MKYRSKVDWWYYLVVLLFSLCTFHVCCSYTRAVDLVEHTFLIFLFLLCEFIFILPTLFFTYYIIDTDAIYIKSGYFFCKYIAYEDIVKIRDTKAIFSACGLATDRIEITYKYKDSIDMVLISPKKKEEVKKELSARAMKQNATDLSSFVKQDRRESDQPMNGIIR